MGINSPVEDAGVMRGAVVRTGGSEEDVEGGGGAVWAAISRLIQLHRQMIFQGHTNRNLLQDVPAVRLPDCLVWPRPYVSVPAQACYGIPLAHAHQCSIYDVIHHNHVKEPPTR